MGELKDQRHGALAVAIRNIRRGMGMSRRDMAALLGCPPGALTVWEIGRHTPSTPRLIKLLFLAQTPDERAAIEKVLGEVGIVSDCLTSPDTLQAAHSSMSQASQ